MPTAADPILLDTSAAVALAVSDHVHHDATLAALRGRKLGLAGHAAFEAYSVLTRLPGAQRLSPAAAARLLTTNFPHTRHLDAADAAALLPVLSAQRVAGGAVYDALVAMAALSHGLVLVSRDLRAAQTYQRLGVRLELLS